MKKLLFSLLGLLSLFPVAAQWKWHNPVEAAYPVVQNQGFVHEIGQSYVRLPDRAHGVVSENVWNLSRNSAGLALQDGDEQLFGRNLLVSFVVFFHDVSSQLVVCKDNKNN